MKNRLLLLLLFMTAHLGAELKTSRSHVRGHAAASASSPSPDASRPADLTSFFGGVRPATSAPGPDGLVVAPTKLRGCITIEGEPSGKVPEFKLYCDGMETTSDSQGFFSFPVMQSEAPLSKYRLIICNKVKHHFKDRNTIDSFGVIPDMNYRCFKFVRSTTAETGWQELERDLKKKNLKIPQHSIVLVLNPAYFARLETWRANLPENTLKLPRIVLVKDATAKIKREAVKSLLYSLDAKPFHEQVSQREEAVAGGLGVRKVADLD